MRPAAAVLLLAALGLPRQAGGGSTSDSFELYECQLLGPFAAAAACGRFVPWVDSRSQQQQRCGVWRAASGTARCDGAAGCAVHEGQDYVGGSAACGLAAVVGVHVSSTDHWQAPAGFSGAPVIDGSLRTAEECHVKCTSAAGCDHFRFTEEKVDMYAADVARRVHVRLESLMQAPLDILGVLQPPVELGFRDHSSTQPLRQHLYSQIVALDNLAVSMIYAGLEDGRFTGYFSATSYTERAAGDGLAAGLSWSPWASSSAMNDACAADVSVCIDAPTAAATCGDGVDAAGATCAVDAAGTGCVVASGACSFVPSATVQPEASCPAPSPPSCAAQDIRNYYSTSHAQFGAPGDVTKFRLYDPRQRPWYIQDLARYAGRAITSIDSGSDTITLAAADTTTTVNDKVRLMDAAGQTCAAGPKDVDLDVLSVSDRVVTLSTDITTDDPSAASNCVLSGSQKGFSTIYSFSTTGNLGISATGTIIGPGSSTPVGVFAVDYALLDINALLVDALSDLPDYTWAYVVERSNAKFVASTTDPVTMAGERIGPADSVHAAVRRSSELFSVSNWAAGGVCGTGTARFEAASKIFSFSAGVDWLVVVGQNIDCQALTVWQSGQCTSCGLGTAPNGVYNCDSCGARQATVDGSCQLCPDGKEKNEFGTACTQCEAGSAGTGGFCQECSSAAGEVASTDSTRCVCPIGTYDAWLSPNSSATRRNIYCWQRSKLLKDEADANGDYSNWQLDVLNEKSTTALETGKRCVECPECVDCSADSVVVLPGFQYFGTGMDLDVFACPLEDTCPGHELRTLDEAVVRNLTCNGRSDGALCADCEAGYYLDRHNQCAACDLVSSKSGLISTFMLVLFLSLRKRIYQKLPLSTTTRERISIALEAGYRSWPRLVQSFRYTLFGVFPVFVPSLSCIFVSNYQITTQISAVVAITWPPVIESIYHSIGNIVNLRIFKFLNLGCTVAFLDSFVGILVTQALLLPSFAVVLYCAYRVQVTHMLRGLDMKTVKRDRTMLGSGHDDQARSSPLPPPLSLTPSPRSPRDFGPGTKQGRARTKTVDAQQIQTAEDVLDKVGIRLRRTVRVALLRVKYYELMFFVVYLLYPGCSAMSFSIFRCRGLGGSTLEEQTARLDADYSILCAGVDAPSQHPAQMTPTGYTAMKALGWLFIGAFPIGIPTVLGFQLYRQRDVIRNNPDYVSLAHLKPLFVFYKPDAYLWEIWFMAEKVIFVGFMGMAFKPPSLLQYMGNILLCVIMLCWLCAVRPSKTEEYNNANILSHMVLLITYLAAGIFQLRRYDNSSRDLNEDQITIGMLTVQLIMAIFLIYISTIKLWQYGSEQKALVQSNRQLVGSAAQTPLEEARERATKHEKDMSELRQELVAMDKNIKEQWATSTAISASEMTGTAVKASGHTLVKAGAAGCDLYLVLHGTAEVRTSLDMPPVTHIRPGDVFGGSVDDQMDVFVRSCGEMEMLVVPKQHSGGSDRTHTTVTINDIIAPSGSEEISAPALRNLSIHKGDKAILEQLPSRSSLRSRLKEAEDASSAARKELEQMGSSQEAALRRAYLLRYKIFDREGDGVLSVEELKIVMEQMGEGLEDSEYEVMMALADAEGDDSLSFEEFELLWGTDINSYRKSAVAWIGSIPPSLASAKDGHLQLAKQMSVFGKVLTCTLWPSPDVVPFGERGYIETGTTWARLEFKGVHAISLAITARGTTNAVVMDDRELQVSAWSQFKENKLRTQLEKLHDFEYQSCTLFLHSIPSEVSDEDVLRQMFEPFGICLDVTVRRKHHKNADVPKRSLAASVSAPPAMSHGQLQFDQSLEELLDDSSYEALVTVGSTDTVDQILADTELAATSGGMKIVGLSNMPSVTSDWNAELTQRHFEADQIVSDLITYLGRTTASLRQVRALDAAAQAAARDGERPSSAPIDEKHDAAGRIEEAPNGRDRKMRAQTVGFMPGAGRSKIQVDQLQF